MKNKRIAKEKEKPHKSFLSTGELIVQCLSSSVTGKAQKYSRIGPREFVSYPYDEMTMDNIKAACCKHFAAMIGKYNICDVLAGDQGPSCKSIDQLPDTKVVHVRFIEPLEVDVDENTQNPEPRFKKMRSDYSLSSQPVTTFSNLKPRAEKYPKSLSLSSMLKLGKHITEKSTAIEIFTFNVDELTWPSCSERVDFTVAKQPFASGGFREAYEASLMNSKFVGKWVVKKYLSETLSVLETMNESVESHTKKVVQMHHLARNMAARLNKMVVDGKKEDEFGERFCFNKIYLGKMGDDYVTVEMFIEGEFVKYMNNTGEKCVEDSDERAKKAECLCHFSFEKSEKKIMIVDIQGSGYKLYDPEIASSDLFDDGKILFCAGNLSTQAIDKFTLDHQCNMYCKLLGLRQL